MNMRWHILRTLLHKEVLRHLANRGGLVLVLLLIVASMLLSFFGHGDVGAAGFAPSVRRCYVDYWQDGELVEHLRCNVPPELAECLSFRAAEEVPTDGTGTLLYVQNTGAIQIRPPDGDAPPTGAYKVCFWHPGSDGSALAPFEIWFWKEAAHFYQRRARPDPSPGDAAARPTDTAGTPSPPVEGGITSERSELAGGLDPRSGLATSLVLFGLFFVCVYLLPSLTCEERERGVLLAQALSPASPREILAAKFLFYPVLGVALGALLAGTYQPRVLTQAFFWLALLMSVVGSMGIGLTIASVARTQRAASMGAMCYMMVVALLQFVCQQGGIPGLPYLALEYHCSRMLHASLKEVVFGYHYAHLAGAAVLACLWTVLATILFRRQGWQ
jgi:hypothetical protein